MLSFSAPTFSIFPNDEGPYCREARYGTAIKMFEYNFIGDRSNILRGTSLLSRLDLLLPEIALPARFYEYRKTKAGKLVDVGSRSTTVAGLLRRIVGSDNVESGFPVRIPFQPDGEKLIANIFAFVEAGSSKKGDGGQNSVPSAKKLGGLRRYRKSEGVVFVCNGQTQGNLPKDFFRRDAVKMKLLADDLLVFVECDGLSNVTREDLSMPSRDRLANNEFKKELVSSLEKVIRECSELRELRNQRQQERMQEHLEDDKPLTEVLQSLIKASPNLTKLLNLGQRISAPFKTVATGSEKNVNYEGGFFPTFFKSKGVEYGQILKRPCHINSNMRLTFETDVCNDYFTRAADRGIFDLSWKGSDGTAHQTSPVGPNLKNGIATVTVDLPSSVRVDDEIEYLASIRDAVGNTFYNHIEVTIQPSTDKHTGGSGQRQPPADNEDLKRERPSMLKPPKIKRVYRSDWEIEGFDEFSAMEVRPLGLSENEVSELYEFKVNMNNAGLESEAKLKRMSNDATELLRKQFLYANVLIGLSMLLDDKRASKNEILYDDELDKNIEDRIKETCRALAPFIPALVSLGSGNLENDDAIDGLEDSA